MNMGGNVAPFSLLTYDDARRRARMIASAVREGRMPPWSAADMHKGTFSNERILEDHEKATLIAWAEGGAPAGDPAVGPPVPGFLIAAAASNGWTRGEPDLIIEFNEEYCLDDDLRDIYADLPATIDDALHHFAPPTRRMAGTFTVVPWRGARIIIDTGQSVLHRQMHGGGSYLAGRPPRVHVGLGTSISARVTVYWPGGGVGGWTLSAGDHDLVQGQAP